MGIKSANTEKSCQTECQRMSQCNWWTLNAYTWDKYGCWLKTEKDSLEKKTIKGATFGPKFCGMYSRIYNVIYKFNVFYLNHKI